MTTVYNNNGLPQYQSVAEMKTVDLSVGSKVKTISYYSGWAASSREATGGTIYNIVNSVQFTTITGESSPDEYGDHTLDNGLIAMIADRAIKNVYQFGAYGDGITNDVPYIRKAYASANFDDGGHVYFPSGTYLLTPDTTNYLWADASTSRKNYAIFLVGNNIISTGDGPSTILKQGSTMDSDGTPTDGRGDYATIHTIANENADNGTTTLVNENIEVRGIRFDGNNINESGIGVTFVGVTNCRIADCYFQDSYYECSLFKYCRGGEFSNNFTNRCGQEGALAEGGGPFVSWCVNINVHYNIFSDSGYYAVHVEDTWDSVVKNNMIRNLDYSYASGLWGIYGKNNSNVKYVNNTISSAAYNGIRDFRGFNNLIQSNTVLACGFGGTGNNIHGILIDDETGTGYGRITITENIAVYNGGAGYLIAGAILDGETNTYNCGTTVSANTALYNLQDGISAYGDNHRITTNMCESNGIDTAGVYNGITLNGCKYCVVSSNSCQDIPQSSTWDFNLDAIVSESDRIVAPIQITHTGRTQYYGIQEAKYGAVISNYNIITNNAILNNLANPGTSTPASGGYNAVSGCGVNSTKANNIGQ
jgi:hypothetical protein